MVPNLLSAADDKHIVEVQEVKMLTPSSRGTFFKVTLVRTNAGSHSFVFQQPPRPPLICPTRTVSARRPAVSVARAMSCSATHFDSV